ncbi:MAG: alanine racemase [Gammaproteobacteria bacterium]|nr:alanine racemase [Gammaproteobacteria bacterium]MDH5275950.1 alanine racemase [Gammaproteobacteria bacterium]
MTPAAVAVIRPAALRNNLERVRELAPGCPVLAVIKANAYGHGLIQVARILEDVDAFAVARLEEAVQLREAGIRKRLVILGGCLALEELRVASDLQFDVVVHSARQAALLEGAVVGGPVACWLKVDTGMGRLGVEPAAVPGLTKRLRSAPTVSSLTLMTHLACADDHSDPATVEQLQVFSRLLGTWEGDASLANSAAILQWPDTLRDGGLLRYPGRNWVRPGIMLFGASPLRGKSAIDLGLRPVMSFETRLIAVKPVRKGQRVGYGGHWVAPRDSVLGIAAAGYADGYPWHVATGTPVGVRGRAAPLVGRVSMDMLTIDLTEVPDAVAGDRVVLWGDSPTVEEIAGAARTIPWTLMTGINRRVAVRIEAGATLA